MKKTSLMNYIGQSLTGAWELVKLNPRGLDYLDKSPDGFWKSFWAIAVAAPVFFLWLSSSFGLAVEQGYQGSIEAHILEFLLRLPLFAVVMVLFTRFLKIDTHYATMIIAYNWLSAIVYCVTLPLNMLMRIGPLPEGVGMLILMVALLYFKVYVAWFMFRHALKISGWLAAGVLLFEMMFSLSVMAVLQRLFL